MKRILVFTGGMCILGSIFAASAPPVQSQYDVAAYEVAAATTTTTDTWVYTTTTTFMPDIKKSGADTVIKVLVATPNDWQPESNITVRLEKRWFNDDHTTVLKTETIETWNTTDSNPHRTPLPKYDKNDSFDVYAVIDPLPYGYTPNGSETALPVAIWQYDWTGSGDHNCNLFLRKTAYEDAFPAEGKFDAQIRFADSETQKLIPGLDVSFVNLSTGEELLSWNTTEHPEMTISNLQYRFEDRYMINTFQYGAVIHNLPEGYTVYTYGNNPINLSYTENNLLDGVSVVPTTVYLISPESTQKNTVTTSTTMLTATETTTVPASSVGTGTETTSIMTTSSDTTTVSNTTAATSTTETTAKAPISDETLCDWAAKDYSDKHQTAVTAEITGKENGKVSIALKDAEGKVLDTYVIDKTSGIGENAAGEAVNLPQTGNNSLADYLAFTGALLLTIAGAWVLYSSYSSSRKRNSQT